jgi:hypothetical protein
MGARAPRSSSSALGESVDACHRGRVVKPMLAVPELRAARHGSSLSNYALQRSHSRVTSRAQGRTGRASRRAAERGRYAAGHVKTLVALTTALTLLSCASHQGYTDPIQGTWVWHQSWESAPDEIVRESGPQWFASGALISVCPGGRFRMATGVLYRASGNITLGPSDGLRLYEGTWHSSGSGVEVRYKLVDAEIRFTGYDEALKRELVARPELVGQRLTFLFQHPEGGGSVPMTFDSAAGLNEEVALKFVECLDGQPAA